MAVIAHQQAFELNSLKVSRDIVSPADLFDRDPVSGVIAGLTVQQGVEIPDVSLITAIQSSIAMRGGPTLEKLFRIYDELAEVVNELNAENLYLEGALGEMCLFGNMKAPPDKPRSVVLTFSEELASLLASDQDRLRKAIGLRNPEPVSTPHATLLRARDQTVAQEVLEGLSGTFQPGEDIVLGKAYIELVHRKNFLLKKSSKV